MCGSKHQGPGSDLHSLDSNTESSKSPHSAGSAGKFFLLNLYKTKIEHVIRTDQFSDFFHESAK